MLDVRVYILTSECMVDDKIGVSWELNLLHNICMYTSSLRLEGVEVQ